MNKENNLSILIFAQTLAGGYTNKAQSEKNPKYFAHINIYFRPIPWDVMNGPGFYSEQIYDHLPWSPYRQSLNKVIIINGILILENYILSNPIRLAGAGRNPGLLKDLKAQKYTLRKGCSMNFKLNNDNHYLGEIESGRKCIVKRGDRESYLVSRVKLTENAWISEDSGFELETNNKFWGSEHGPFFFDKSFSLKDDINESWINNNHDI